MDVPQCVDRILPPGVHAATIAEIERMFVVELGNRGSRREIFDAWQVHRMLFRKLLNVQAEYVDGSFVTSRRNPSDVDIALVVKAADLEGLDLLELRTIRQYLRGNPAFHAFRVDVTLIPECGQSSPLWDEYQEALQTLHTLYPTAMDIDGHAVDRSLVTKGYVRVAP